MIQHASLGGGTLLAMLLARSLDAARYEVTLAMGPHSGAEGSLLDEMRQQGLTVRLVPDLVRSPHPSKDWRAIRQLRDLFREVRPHVVHTHGSKPKVLTPWAALGAPVPVKVAHIHGWEWHPARNALQRALYVGASRLRIGDYAALVATSDALRRQGLARRVGRPDQYAVIRPAVDVHSFAPATPSERRAARAELGLPPQAFVAVSVTRLSAQKAPGDLVAAADLLRASYPDAHLLIVGAGPLVETITADIQQRGLGGQVHLLGSRRDVPRILHAADAFVLSSHWEPLGMVYLEAAACGLPCVGTDVDGAREAVKDGETGLMVDPQHPEGLAAALGRLAGDPVLRAQMGRAGREKSLAFSEETFLAAVDDLYQRLLVAAHVALPPSPPQ